MTKAVCRLTLACALYAGCFAALGNAATDQLVMTDHTGGQYTYAIDFGAVHNFFFVTGQQIKLTGLSGVTRVDLLNSLTTGVFDPPAFTANSVTLTVAANHPSSITTSGRLSLMTVTSTVLKAEAFASFQVQDGNATISGAVAGPGTIPLTVWRPSDGVWYLNLGDGVTPITRQWGLPGDLPITGDFDGDQVPDFVVWRPSEGNWYIQPGNGVDAPTIRQWGLPGDIPVAGDFDGDGKTDFAVWRPANGTWFIIPSRNPATPVIKQWGLPGDIPVVADFDGDGKADFTVWRPTEGNWYVTFSSTGATSVEQWGLPGDIPVAADFDGDGKSDVAVWRPDDHKWFIMNSSTNATLELNFGETIDIPVPRDFDGDGKADIAQWRPTIGFWGIRPSIPGNPGVIRIVQWGLHGDIPVSKPAGLLVPQILPQ